MISIGGWLSTYVPGYRHSAPERGWAVRESVCRRDKRASAKMRKGGILHLGKADSSRLKPVRNDKGDIACSVTYIESQRWKRCATQKLSRARAPAPQAKRATPKKLSSPASGGIFGKAFIRWRI